jgi:PAS domain S-box-containing protein
LLHDAGKHDLDIVIDRLGGSFRMVVTPLFNSEREVRAILHVMEDVTSRNQAEQSLRESEQRYRLLAENTNDLIWTCDLDLRATYVSPSVESLRGYTVEEVMEQSIDEILAPDSAALAVKTLKEKLAAAEGDPSVLTQPARLDVEQICKDGSTVWTEMNVSFLLDDGVPVGLIGVTRDITERKQAEEAIQREQRLLKELVDLNEQERKVVAYEIHDGLAQQLSGVQMRLQSFAEANEPTSGKADRLLEETRQLVAESIAEARRLISGLRPAVLDESDIVGAVDWLVQECGRHHRQLIEFRHKIEQDRLAHPARIALFRIVQEALNNACRHSQSEVVRVEIADKGDHVCAQIQDWGVGFDSTQVKKGRFGLQGMRERARLLGGQIVIETSPSKGTRIEARLPIVD